MFLKKFVFIILLSVMVACSNSPAKKSYAVLDQQYFVIKQLNDQYNSWQGAPYEYGGTSIHGIDCSAFVQRTFGEKLKINLPRETELQAKMGHSVSIRKLEPGDLVFFNTGKKIRHVGIYVSDGNFLHASTSKGVTLSRIDNPYWKKNFWKAKRLR